MNPGTRTNKILNGLLVLTSLVGYLEWGGGNSMFLFQAEADILHKLVTDPSSVVHPFILLPLAGQALLAFTLFQKKPSTILARIGAGGIGILLFFMFVIGIITFNYNIILSTLPFLVLAAYVFYRYRRIRTPEH